MVAVGVVMLFALGHSQAGTSLAGETTDGAMVVDCDTSQGGIQDECTYAPGSSFNIAVHVTQPPAAGYFQIQAKLGWTEGVLNYLPAAAGDEALWPECTFAASTNNWTEHGVPSVFIACAVLPPLAVGDTFTGAVFTFELQCKAAPNAIGSPPAGLDRNQSLLELISSVNEPFPSQGGTIFVDADIQPVNPVLTDATVTCAAGPPPPPPTPTPLPPPPAQALVFVGTIDDASTDPDHTPPVGDFVLCGGGGTITLILSSDGSELTEIRVSGFNIAGGDVDTNSEFDPGAVPIAADGTFGSEEELLDEDTGEPTGLISFIEGTFDFSDDPATLSTVSGSVGTHGTIECGPTFSAEQLPAGAELDVLGAAVTPTVDVSALPGTGAGALDAQRGAGAGLWAMIGAFLVAAAAGLSLYGWRYARTR
jgi:hypothetical protein